MTDREKIRRLAGVVWDHLTEQLPTKNLVNELARIMDAEPAAPTVTQIEEAFDRGYEQARRDLIDGALKGALHPTVTREQAEHVRNAVIVWLDSYGSLHGFHDLFTESESPAFFRAVADQLDKEA